MDIISINQIHYNIIFSQPQDKSLENIICFVYNKVVLLDVSICFVHILVREDLAAGRNCKAEGGFGRGFCIWGYVGYECCFVTIPEYRIVTPFYNFIT